MLKAHAQEMMVNWTIWRSAEKSLPIAAAVPLGRTIAGEVLTDEIRRKTGECFGLVYACVLGESIPNVDDSKML